MAAFARLGHALERAARESEAVAASTDCLETFERTRLALYEESRLEIAVDAEEATARLISLLADPTSSAYDVVAALQWIERTKSRTFVETLGLSQLDPPTADGSETAFLEEQRLLDRINSLRERLFISPDGSAGRMSLQHEMHACLDRLRRVWEKLAPSHGEYVSLREGHARWSGANSAA
jgi:hypothetical protein